MTFKILENSPSSFAQNGWNDLHFNCGKLAIRLDTAPNVALRIYWNASFWYTGFYLEISKNGFRHIWKHEWDEV